MAAAAWATLAVAAGAVGMSAREFMIYCVAAVSAAAVLAVVLAGFLHHRNKRIQAAEKKSKLEQQVAQRLMAEEQLLAALSQPMGFHNGKPLAAMVVYRTCLQWGAFQADKTTLFNRILQVIYSQIERRPDDIAWLAYWLTNMVTLLHLLQRTIKQVSCSGDILPAASEERVKIKKILSNSQLKNGKAFGYGGSVGDLYLVEAKYPALQFKLNLLVIVSHIAYMMQQKMANDLAPMLEGHCRHAPCDTHGCAGGDCLGATAAAASGSGDKATDTADSTQSKFQSDMMAVFDKLLVKLSGNYEPNEIFCEVLDDITGNFFNSVDNRLFTPGDAGMRHSALAASFSTCSIDWGGLLHMFDELLVKLRDNHMPKSVVRALFKKLFLMTNAKLLIKLLLRKRHCFMACNGECVNELRLAKMESGSTERDLNWEGLELCEKAMTFLLFGISKVYWDNKYNTETVSSEVLGPIQQGLMERDSSVITSFSFLLEDDCLQMEGKDLYTALPVPELLKSGTGEGAASFAFLAKEMRFRHSCQQHAVRGEGSKVVAAAEAGRG